MAPKNVTIPMNESLARQHMPLAGQIARRLARRYGWIHRGDLESYAYLGLALAEKAFDASRGVPFLRFACIKGMYLAIDEMRKDGVLRRANSRAPTTDLGATEIDLPDPGSERATELLEARDLCAQLLMRLSQKDRQLIGMIYADRMTYREVAATRGVTESAICLKHNALLRKLRRQAEARKLVA